MKLQCFRPFSRTWFTDRTRSLLHHLQAAADWERWLSFTFHSVATDRCSCLFQWVWTPTCRRWPEWLMVCESSLVGRGYEERECWPACVRNYLERGGTAIPACSAPKSTFKQSEIVSSFQICVSMRVFLPCFSIKQLSFHSSRLSISFPPHGCFSLFPHSLCCGEYYS